MTWKMPETVKLMFAAHCIAKLEVGDEPLAANEPLIFYIRNHDVVDREFNRLLWSQSRILQLFVWGEHEIPAKAAA